MEKGHGILGASCVEASEARLRAADEAMICLFFLLLFLFYVLVTGLSGGAAGRLSRGKGTWNSWRELRGDERSEAPRSG